MKPSEKTKSDNEENTHYSQENTVKIEKRIFLYHTAWTEIVVQWNGSRAHCSTGNLIYNLNLLDF